MTMSASSFIPSLSLSTVLHNSQVTSSTSFRCPPSSPGFLKSAPLFSQPTHFHPIALTKTTPTLSISPPPLKVKDIVVVDTKTPTSRPTLAQITNVDSSNTTVDVTYLEPYIREFYTKSKSQSSSFEKIENVCKVRADYDSRQDGWVILDADIAAVRNEFEQKREIEGKGGVIPRAKVEKEERRELSEDALKRQFLPKPSKRQAFIGAGLSIPLAAVLYALRQSYVQVGGGEDQTNAAFRQLMVGLTGAGSGVTLFAGISLLLLAATNVFDNPSRDK